VLSQSIDFSDERQRIDNDAVANHTNLSTPEYSRGNKVEDVFGAPMNDRVPGIVAALAADNNVSLGSEHIDDFAFSLIAPLRAD
jgi:hypothetical protein